MDDTHVRGCCFRIVALSSDKFNSSVTFLYVRAAIHTELWHETHHGKTCPIDNVEHVRYRAGSLWGVPNHVDPRLMPLAHLHAVLRR